MGSPMTPAVKDFTCSLTGDRCSLHQAAMLQKKSHGKHNKQTCTYRLTLSLATGQKKNKTKPFRLRWEWQDGRHQGSGCCCCSALAWVSGEIHFSQPFLTHVKDKGYLYPFSILGLQELSSTTLLSHKYQSRGKSWGLTNLIYSFIFPRPDATLSCSSAQRRTNDIMYKSRDLRSPGRRVQKSSLSASLPTQTPFITWMWLRKRRQLALWGIRAVP